MSLKGKLGFILFVLDMVHARFPTDFIAGIVYDPIALVTQLNTLLQILQRDYNIVMIIQDHWIKFIQVRGQPFKQADDLFQQRQGDFNTPGF